MDCESKQNTYNLSMYESKENLKHYAILIKSDFTSYIGNKNIDGGDYFEQKFGGDCFRHFSNCKNASNGVDPSKLWVENGYKESEPFNKDNYVIPATPLRAKIAL